MSPLRSVIVLGAVLALLSAAPAAHAAEGPELSVPAQQLAAALDCPRSLAGAGRAPVLLIPGTNLEPRNNFDWNYQPALTAAGVPWCAVTLPRFGLGDIQVAAEYVVHALRTMRAQAGRRVSIIGWSQGGMIGRWALKYWPDTRGMVEDLVGLASSNHGTQGATALCRTDCPPSYWQQRDTARFIAALNDGPETWAGIDYTVAFTRFDQVVTPNQDEAAGSSALRTGAGARRNVLLQQLCPTNTADHFAIGSYDAVGWALAFDAISHPGPADPSRVGTGVCAQPFMPGVDPAAFPANYARFTGTVGQSAAQSEYVSAEPPLRCYVTGSCATTGTSGGATRTAGTRSCTSRRRFVIHLDRRFRRARVVVGARAVRVRRRAGRLEAVVDLRGRSRGAVRVRIRAVSRSGRTVTRTRRYRPCVARRGPA